MNGALTPGFADTIRGAQTCFRLLLDATAHPGRLHEVHGVEAPAPLCDAAAAIVLTLMDHETPLWLDPAADPARAWIAFHTGAPIIRDPARAMFVLALSLTGLTPTSVAAQAGACDADKPSQDGGVTGVATGTDETPESSATVILQVASLTTGCTFVLEGPGLREPALLAIDGLPADFVETWQRNHALFPRGIDLILCAGTQIAALPRSVSVREA